MRYFCKLTATLRSWLTGSESWGGDQYVQRAGRAPSVGEKHRISKQILHCKRNSFALHPSLSSLRKFPMAAPSVSRSGCYLPILLRQAQDRRGGFGLLRLRKHPPTPRLRRALPSLLSQAWERDNARYMTLAPWRPVPACLRRQSRRP